MNMSQFESLDFLDQPEFPKIVEMLGERIEDLEQSAAKGSIEAQIQLKALLDLRERLVELGKKHAKNGVLSPEQSKELASVTHKLQITLLSGEGVGNPLLEKTKIHGSWLAKDIKAALKKTHELTATRADIEFREMIALRKRANKLSLAAKLKFKSAESGVSRNLLVEATQSVTEDVQYLLDKVYYKKRDGLNLEDAKFGLDSSCDDLEIVLDLVRNIDVVYKNEEAVVDLLDKIIDDRSAEDVRAKAKNNLAQLTRPTASGENLKEAVSSFDFEMFEEDKPVVLISYDAQVEALESIGNQKLTQFLNVLYLYDTELYENGNLISAEFAKRALKQLNTDYPDASNVGLLAYARIEEFKDYLKATVTQDAIIEKVDKLPVVEIAKKYPEYLQFVQTEDYYGPVLTAEAVNLKLDLSKATDEQLKKLNEIFTVLAKYEAEKEGAIAEEMLDVESNVALRHLYQGIAYQTGGKPYKAQAEFVAFMEASEGDLTLEGERKDAAEKLRWIADKKVGEFVKNLNLISTSLDVDVQKKGHMISEIERDEIQEIDQYLDAQRNALTLALSLMDNYDDVLTLEQGLDVVRKMSKGSVQKAKEAMVLTHGYSAVEANALLTRLTEFERSSALKWNTNEKFAFTPGATGSGKWRGVHVDLLNHLDFSSRESMERGLEELAIFFSWDDLHYASEDLYRARFRDLFSENAVNDLDFDTFSNRLLKAATPLAKAKIAKDKADWERISTLSGEAAEAAGASKVLGDFFGDSVPGHFENLSDRVSDGMGKLGKEEKFELNLREYTDDLIEFETSGLASFMLDHEKKHGKKPDSETIAQYSKWAKDEIAKKFWTKMVHQRIVSKIERGSYSPEIARGFLAYNDSYLKANKKIWEVWEMTAREKQAIWTALPLNIALIVVSGGTAGAVAGGGIVKGAVGKTLVKKLGRELAEDELSLILTMSTKQLIAQYGKQTALMMGKVISRAKLKALPAEAAIFSEMLMYSGAADPGGFEAWLSPVEHLKRWGHSTMALGIIKGVNTAFKEVPAYIRLPVALPAESVALTAGDTLLEGGNLDIAAVLQGNLQTLFGLKLVHGAQGWASKRGMARVENASRQERYAEWRKSVRGEVREPTLKLLDSYTRGTEAEVSTRHIHEGMSDAEILEMVRSSEKHGIKSESWLNLNLFDKKSLLKKVRESTPDQLRIEAEAYEVKDFNLLLSSAKARFLYGLYLKYFKSVSLSSSQVVEIAKIDATLASDVIQKLFANGQNDVLAEIAKEGVVKPFMADPAFAMAVENLHDLDSSYESKEASLTKLADLVANLPPWLRALKYTSFAIVLSSCGQLKTMGSTAEFALGNFYWLGLGIPFLINLAIYLNQRSEAKELETKASTIKRLLDKFLIDYKNKIKNRTTGDLGKAKQKIRDMSSEKKKMENLRDVLEVLDGTLFSEASIDIILKINTVFDNIFDADLGKPLKPSVKKSIKAHLKRIGYFKMPDGSDTKRDRSNILTAGKSAKNARKAFDKYLAEASKTQGDEIRNKFLRLGYTPAKIKAVLGPKKSSIDDIDVFAEDALGLVVSLKASLAEALGLELENVDLDSIKRLIRKHEKIITALEENFIKTTGSRSKNVVPEDVQNVIDDLTAVISLVEGTSAGTTSSTPPPTPPGFPAMNWRYRVLHDVPGFTPYTGRNPFRGLFNALNFRARLTKDNLVSAVRHIPADLYNWTLPRAKYQAGRSKTYAKDKASAGRDRYNKKNKLQALPRDASLIDVLRAVASFAEEAQFQKKANAAADVAPRIVDIENKRDALLKEAENLLNKVLKSLKLGDSEISFLKIIEDLAKENKTVSWDKVLERWMEKIEGDKKNFEDARDNLRNAVFEMQDSIGDLKMKRFFNYLLSKSTIWMLVTGGLLGFGIFQSCERTIGLGEDDDDDEEEGPSAKEIRANMSNLEKLRVALVRDYEYDSDYEGHGIEYQHPSREDIENWNNFKDAFDFYWRSAADTGAVTDKELKDIWEDIVDDLEDTWVEEKEEAETEIKATPKQKMSDKDVRQILGEAEDKINNLSPDEPGSATQPRKRRPPTEGPTQKAGSIVDWYDDL